MTQTQPAVPHPPHESHGHSIAAWTAVTVIMVGALISSIAVAVASALLFWVGVAVAVVGALSGPVLAAMGFGQSGAPRE